MSNDNKSNLKADHKQRPKHSNRAFIVYMLLMTALFSLLLVPSCQQEKAQGVTDKQRGGNHG